jgi:hypothetical protein
MAYNDNVCFNRIAACGLQKSILYTKNASQPTRHEKEINIQIIKGTGITESRAD